MCTNKFVRYQFGGYNFPFHNVLTQATRMYVHLECFWCLIDPDVHLTLYDFHQFLCCGEFSCSSCCLWPAEYVRCRDWADINMIKCAVKFIWKFVDKQREIIIWVWLSLQFCLFSGFQTSQIKDPLGLGTVASKGNATFRDQVASSFYVFFIRFHLTTLRGMAAFYFIIGWYIRQCGSPGPLTVAGVWKLFSIDIPFLCKGGGIREPLKVVRGPGYSYQQFLSRCLGSRGTCWKSDLSFRSWPWMYLKQRALCVNGLYHIYPSTTIHLSIICIAYLYLSLPFSESLWGKIYTECNLINVMNLILLRKIAIFAAGHISIFGDLYFKDSRHNKNNFSR